MKYSTSLIFIFLLPFIGSSQIMDWAFNIGGSKSDKSFDIVKDNQGSMYITGSISDSVNFNPMGIPYFKEAIDKNSSSIYIAKYDKNYRLTWSVVVGNSYSAFGSKILLDDSMNVYIIGRATGIVDFDPSSSVYSLNCTTDGFVAKYDNNGNFQAANTIPMVSDFSEKFLNPDSKIFIDTQRHIYTYSNDTLSKFTQNLQVLWKKTISGQPEFFNDSLFYSVRHFKTPFYTEPYFIGSETNIILDIYDKNSGNPYDTIHLANTIGYLCGGLIKKTKSNKLLISGNFWGDMSCYGANDTIIISNQYLAYGPGSIRYPETREFIAQFDDNGNVEWAKGDNLKEPRPHLIETDEDGFIYCVGFRDNFYEDRAFFSKYDSNFTHVSTSTYYASPKNFIGGFKLYGDTAVISGHFGNTLNLRLSGSQFSLASAGQTDFFIARYSNFEIPSYYISTPNTPQLASKEVTPYPNPTKGVFNLKFDTEFAFGKLSIYDLNGNHILSKNIHDKEIEIDISKFPNATYTIILEFENSSTSIKILKVD